MEIINRFAAAITQPKLPGENKMPYRVSEIEITEENIRQLIESFGTEKIMVVYNADTQDSL